MPNFDTSAFFKGRENKLIIFTYTPAPTNIPQLHLTENTLKKKPMMSAAYNALTKNENKRSIESETFNMSLAKEILESKRIKT